ncbi:MAG: hypothetical protein ACK55I_48255, partial [bacterium]
RCQPPNLEKLADCPDLVAGTFCDATTRGRVAALALPRRWTAAVSRSGRSASGRAGAPQHPLVCLLGHGEPGIDVPVVGQRTEVGEP